MKDELKFYLNEVNEASKRSRTILYLILIATAIIFAFQWKSLEGSWLENRVLLRRGVINHWNELNNLTNKTPASATPYAYDDWIRDSNTLVRLRAEEPEVTKPELERRLKSLEADFFTTDTFSLPFLHVTFDINDFIFFSALQLFILGIIFLFCLMREEENLNNSYEYFKKPPADNLQSFYDMASMQQVWNLPGKKGNATRLLRLGQVFIFVLPLAVEWWVFIYHLWVDEKDWEMLNPFLCHLMVQIDIVLMLLLTAVMAGAGYLFFRMDEIWGKMRRDLGIEPSAPPQPENKQGQT